MLIRRQTVHWATDMFISTVLEELDTTHRFWTVLCNYWATFNPCLHKEKL